MLTTLLTSHVFFVSKRRTSVTQIHVVMAESAQRQMEHTFVPVWKDTRESTVKVKFFPPSSTMISTAESRTLVVTMVTTNLGIFDIITVRFWPMLYSGRQK